MSQAPPRASRPGPSKVLPAVDFSRQSLGHILGLRRRSVGGVRPRGRLFVCDRSEAEALRCVCQAAEASEPGASDACWRCARSRALAPRPLRPLTLLADVSDARTHTHTHTHAHTSTARACACVRALCVALRCAALRCGRPASRRRARAAAAAQRADAGVPRQRALLGRVRRRPPGPGRLALRLGARLRLQPAAGIRHEPGGGALCWLRGAAAAGGAGRHGRCVRAEATREGIDMLVAKEPAVSK